MMRSVSTAESIVRTGEKTRTWRSRTGPVVLTRENSDGSAASPPGEQSARQGLPRGVWLPAEEYRIGTREARTASLSHSCQ